MENQKPYKQLLVPALAVLLFVYNYWHLSGTENIRAIHIVTLVGLGVAVGVLLRNTIIYFRESSKQ